MLDVYCCDIPLSISKEEEIKVFLPKDILERLQQLDLNNTGSPPAIIIPCALLCVALLLTYSISIA